MLKWYINNYLNTKNKGMSVSNTKLRPIIIALASAIAVQGCATGPGQKSGSISESFKQTFNNDDPCANSKRNIGVAIGAIAGAIVGSQVAGDKNKLAGVLIGTAAGAGIGGFIGAEIDKRQCEIAKIQKKYNADIQVMPINASTSSNQNAQTTTTAATQSTSTNVSTKTVGLSVNVVDKNGEPQFASGSDDLSQKSREMFTEIASQYKPPSGADEASKKSAEILKTRRVLLIGHTDDTGSTNVNAELSERRAKNVAKIFKSAGVPEAQIFYQGAGETLPLADNATEDGRAVNRRVEIVDLSDEDTFKLYLQNRRANTEFYRAVESDNHAGASQSIGTSSTAVTSGGDNIKPSGKPRGREITQVVDVAPKLGKSTVDNQAINTSNPVSVLGSATERSSMAGSEHAVTAFPDTVKAIKGKPTSRTPTPTSGTIVKTARQWIDFGGSPAAKETKVVNIGEIAEAKPRFSLISEAKASDMRKISACNMDRPRDSGAVKSLKDGSEYATNEFLPGVYGGSWSGLANGHLVSLTHVAVLRNGNSLARKPELLIYKDYKNSKSKLSQKSVPDVNVYRGDQAMLYRVFDSGSVKCMDVVIPNNSPKEAPNSTIFYNNGNTLYSTQFSLTTK